MFGFQHTIKGGENNNQKNIDEFIAEARVFIKTVKPIINYSELRKTNPLLPTTLPNGIKAAAGFLYKQSCQSKQSTFSFLDWLCTLKSRDGSNNLKEKYLQPYLTQRGVSDFESIFVSKKQPNPLKRYVIREEQAPPSEEIGNVFKWYIETFDKEEIEKFNNKKQKKFESNEIKFSVGEGNSDFVKLQKEVEDKIEEELRKLESKQEIEDEIEKEKEWKSFLTFTP